MPDSSLLSTNAAKHKGSIINVTSRCVMKEGYIIKWPNTYLKLR
jgi:hypothetical protein